MDGDISEIGEQFGSYGYPVLDNDWDDMVMAIASRHEVQRLTYRRLRPCSRFMMAQLLHQCLLRLPLALRNSIVAFLRLATR